jgi:hypothetical protein
LKQEELRLLQSIPLDEIEAKVEPVMRLRPRQLDQVLGRVLIPGQVSLLHGPDRAPLTLVAHAVAAGAVSEGGRCLFLDSGGNYNPNLMRAMLAGGSSESVARIIVGPVLGLVDLREALKSIRLEDHLLVVVIDSLTAILNLTGDIGSKERQRDLFGVLEELRKAVNGLGFHALMTDFSSNDWSTGSRRAVGGNVLAHNIDTSAYCSWIRRVEDGILLTVERSPVFPPPSSVAVKLGVRGPRSLGRR